MVNLKKAYLGGIRRRETKQKYPHNCDNCEEPMDHRCVFRGLVDQICGAFKYRVLSSEVRIGGMLDLDSYAVGDRR